jgi:alkanesulfonate monooxygenase SsuD/methylene tetrahydromethanopterin reductase-like flavin-dependent oxidoreductase (luciferase family)
MRVGVFLLAARFPGQSDGEVLAAAVEAAVAAVAAERAGFDDVWVAEHHFMFRGSPSKRTLALFTGRKDRSASCSFAAGGSSEPRRGTGGESARGGAP